AKIIKKHKMKKLENLINRYNLSLDMLKDRLDDSKEYIDKVSDIVSKVYILLGKNDRKMTFKKLNERITSTKTTMDTKKEAFDNLKTAYDSIVKNYNEVRTREERLKMIISRRKTRSMYYEYVKYKTELSRLTEISSLTVKLPIVPEVKTTSDDDSF
ncbi:MAG: hypothetical protein KAS64_08445, partial [Spirochaetes bacterium]|nr:hypothetical protein [Spirochaetota bacterium]